MRINNFSKPLFIRFNKLFVIFYAPPGLKNENKEKNYIPKQLLEIHEKSLVFWIMGVAAYIYGTIISTLNLNSFIPINLFFLSIR